MAIWVVLALMTGAAVLTLLLPLSRRAAPAAAGAGGPQAGTVATETGFYRDQLDEIARDQSRGLIAEAEAQAARSEAARRLLRASRSTDPRVAGEGEPALRRRRAASAFALSTIPLVALLAYGLYGSPDMPAEPVAERPASAGAATTQDLAQAVGVIEAHLAKHPEDGRGWLVIAPIYLGTGRPEEAVHAYETALTLLGDDPDRLSSYGEAIVVAGDGVVSRKAREAFERARALDPKAPKAGFYLGRAAEQDGDLEGARGRYAAVVADAPSGAPWLPIVRDRLARLDGGAAPAPMAGAPSSEPSPVSGPDPEAARQIAGLPPAERQAMIRGMVDNLDQRLSARGGNADEWVRLMRAYGVLGEGEKARAALGRARAALSGDAAALARVEAVAREGDGRAAAAEAPR